MKRIACLLIIPILAFAGCSGREGWRTSTRLYFDTICEITIFCSEEAHGPALKEVEEHFQEIEQSFSPYSTDRASPRVLYLFHRAREIHRASNGAFDITVAPLSRLWGFEDKEFRLPSQEEVERALLTVGLDRVELGEEGLEVPPDTGLDWGGIAKGYGIDLASRSLQGSGITRGFINAGGDLYCWGRNPDGRNWQVGIIHPREQGILRILDIRDTAAATTGDYQRFFMEGGERYHHVFDPRSGYPAQGKQSVTVIGPEALLCDALSTALFVLEAPDPILRLYPEYGAVIVDSKGKISSAGKQFPLGLR